MSAVGGWRCSVKCCTSSVSGRLELQSAPPLPSDLHNNAHVSNRIVCCQMNRRERKKRRVKHLCHVSVRRKVRSVRHAVIDWQMPAWAWMPTLILRGTRRKETDNPVLIFWMRKINQHPPQHANRQRKQNIPIWLPQPQSSFKSSSSKIIHYAQRNQRAIKI